MRSTHAQLAERAENIRRFILNRPGLNRSHFARIVDLPESNFSAWVNGKRSLPIPYIDPLESAVKLKYGYDPEFAYEDEKGYI